ncbi:hypothetical protein ENSA5_19530 [Enhygromyxa salina]|uniref:Uncharacterized protein n=1 Tax=Enhygromyxa salina TaxID=215803 RepID=A0A2S9YD25_9BACT|nr:hypothetical protein [Enhygromyxa salina]PRQ03014.1 hypothetical protein ENSA5_19530 [Enhygromyxa salina]
MTTALIISEHLELHDDTLLADLDRIFEELARTIEPTPPGESHALLLLVDELVDEMLVPGGGEREQLSISLEIEVGGAADHQDDQRSAEVAEVA